MKSRLKKKVFVIGNRPSIDSPLNVTFLTELYPQLINKKILLYVGYIQPFIRGIEPVINTLKYLTNDVCFAILGVGRIDEFKEHIDTYLGNEESIKERILFLNPVSPDSVISVLSGAHVSTMLIPPINESFNSCAPNKLFESIVAEIPILASNNKTFPVYIYKNRIGKIGEIATDESPETLARLIIEMLDDKNQKLYKQNLQALKYDFAWENEANKLTKLYSNLIFKN